MAAISGSRFRSEAERNAIVLRAWRRDAAGVVDTLIRNAQDLAGGSAEHPSVRWLRAVVHVSSDLGDLMHMASGLPEQTLALREFAADVADRIATVARAAAADDPETFDSFLAGSINNLANRLSELGRREAALAAAEEAVALYRQLAAARPDAFTPNRARSLSVLADRLEEIGRVSDAVSHDHAAVSALTPYCLAAPIAFGPQMIAYVRDYIRRAEATGIGLDRELLTPIIDRLIAAGLLKGE